LLHSIISGAFVVPKEKQKNKEKARQKAGIQIALIHYLSCCAATATAD
jgi:hypothetical protein